MACAYAVGLKNAFGYDDSLDVVGVHLVGGLVGTLLIGLLAAARSRASRSAGAVGGLVGAIGAIGGFILPLTFALVQDLTGKPQTVFLVLLATLFVVLAGVVAVLGTMWVIQ